MELFGLINLGVLPLLLEAMSPTYARREHREEDAKHSKQEQFMSIKRPHEAKPTSNEKAPGPRGKEEQKPLQSKPVMLKKKAKSSRDMQQGQVEGEEERQRNVLRRQQAKVQLEQHGHEDEHQAVWHKHRAHNWQSEHRNWQERGGYDGYRIPEERYRGYFGPGHAFRIFNYPLVVLGGHPLFQYCGFWFSVVDPWPEYWSSNWYDNDDVYIDYSGGGYYLNNRTHPLDRIAVTVYVS